MSDLQNMRSDAGDRVDTTLRKYFQAEMPSPWPALNLPEEPATPRRSVLQGLVHNAGRMALAASIIGLIVGYLALNAAFPPEKAVSKLHGPTIGLHGDGKNIQRPHK